MHMNTIIVYSYNYLAKNVFLSNRSMNVIVLPKQQKEK